MSISRALHLAPLSGCLVLLTLGSCQGQNQGVVKSGENVFPTSPSGIPWQPLPREQGQRLYSGLCQSCHGADGRGATALARDLEPPPADLSRCNFKYRSTPAGSIPLDDDLMRTIYVGLPGTAMPSFAGLLSLPAHQALVHEVKDRCVRFRDEKPEAPIPMPRPFLYDLSSVARGQKIYQREGCTSCHGPSGRGDGPAAKNLKDVSGRKIAPRDHGQGIYRSGYRRIDVCRAFSTGLDGTPMPGLPDEVPENERWDLVHYLVSLSHNRSWFKRAILDAPNWVEPLRTWKRPWW